MQNDGIEENRFLYTFKVSTKLTKQEKKDSDSSEKNTTCRRFYVNKIKVHKNCQ